MSPILLVDDDRDWSEAMALYLEALGLRGVVAHNGEEALALLRGGLRPAVIVLDLSMPRMTGLAFRLAQLSEPELALIPVVVCSAAYDTAAASESLCADAFLEKPVAPARLVRVACDLAARRALQIAAAAEISPPIDSMAARR